MKKAILVILMIALFGLATSSFAAASTVEHVSVRSGYQEALAINLEARQTVRGTFNITGTGSDDTLDFWVRNPDGVIILDSGTVSEGEDFMFTAVGEGKYVLNFQNNAAYNKHVDLEYSVTSYSLPIVGLDPAAITVMVIATGMVLVVTGFVVYRARVKRKTEQ